MAECSKSIARPEVPLFIREWYADILGIRLWQAGKEKYQRREKRHFSVIRFTPEGNHKGDNSVSEKSQVGETIYPRLSGKTQHCE